MKYSSKKHKTGLMNIKPNKISYKILKWMQANEPKLKKTTAHRIAEQIIEDGDLLTGTITVEQTLSNMVICSVIYRDRYEKSIYSDYRINYWHKSIPADILADAPVEVKRAMAKTIDDIKPNQYMDDGGCVVTPNAVEKTADPFSEDVETISAAPSDWKIEKVFDCPSNDDTIDTVEPVKEEPTKVEQVKAEPIEEKPKQMSIPVEVKDDGKTINITVNFTINS